jgi:AraC family transcriptional regulator, regulatory protein of adaptative response / methylated-DNA-[protein]-cysteine methyltransferase
MNPQHEDYTRIEKAIAYLQAHAARHPSLEEVAAHLNLSPAHFQRLFTRWAGISPKRFLQFLTKEHAKSLLDRTSVLQASLQSGLSSPSRLHDLLIHTEAVTPGEYKQRGAGLQIQYGWHTSPFGACLIAKTGRGICFMGFGDHSLDALKEDWQKADLSENPSAILPLWEQIFVSGLARPEPLPLHLRGTNFQIQVWQALLQIPAGSVTSYENLASQLGQEKAARAVGNAVAHNHIAYLIPCHRVLRKSGQFGNYRYGILRKQAMLAWESSTSIAIGEGE